MVGHAIFGLHAVSDRVFGPVIQRFRYPFGFANAVVCPYGSLVTIDTGKPYRRHIKLMWIDVRNMRQSFLKADKCCRIDLAILRGVVAYLGKYLCLALADFDIRRGSIFVERLCFISHNSE